MFDLVFDALSAWNQIGLFIMAFVFLLIGGGLIGYEVYWRLKARVIRGRIIGIRAQKAQKNGTYYYSVLEYKGPDGSRCEQVSDFGSGSILSRVPGQYVKLMMMPHKPDKVRRPTMIFVFFGLVFFAPGLFIMNTAIESFEPNFMMVALPIALIGFAVFKIWSAIQRIPAEERKKHMDAFKSKRSQGFSVSSGSKDKGRLLDDKDIAEAVQKSVKQAKIFGYVMLLISLGMGGGSYYLGLGMKERLEIGLRARGEIVGRKYNRPSSSDSQGTYSAIVEFDDGTGRRYKFTEKHGSSHPTFKKGDAVTVIYMPDNPQDAIIDHGIWNWLLSGGLGLGALLLIWGALYNLTMVRKHGGGRARV